MNHALHTLARFAVGEAVLITVKACRQRRPFRRADGTWVQFEDNACVLTNEKGELKGSDIKGPVSRESAERWPRVAATAKQIV